MSDLLNCPFCGAQPKVTRETLDERVGYADLVSIRCSCGCTLGAMGDTSTGGYADNSTTELRAFAKWNRRTK